MYRRHFLLFAGVSAILAIPSAAATGFNWFAAFGSIFNAGVAPVYRPYTLALQFHGQRDTIVELPADVRKWLPGDTLVEETLPVPDLPAGEYRIRVALLDPRTQRPAVILGIAGKQNDGWYDLGPITVGQGK